MKELYEKMCHVEGNENQKPKISCFRYYFIQNGLSDILKGTQSQCFGDVQDRKDKIDRKTLQNEIIINHKGTRISKDGGD